MRAVHTCNIANLGVQLWVVGVKLGSARHMDHENHHLLLLIIIINNTPPLYYFGLVSTLQSQFPLRKCEWKIRLCSVVCGSLQMRCVKLLVEGKQPWKKKNQNYFLKGQPGLFRPFRECWLLRQRILIIKNFRHDLSSLLSPTFTFQ